MEKTVGFLEDFEGKEDPFAGALLTLVSITAKRARNWDQPTALEPRNLLQVMPPVPSADQLGLAVIHKLPH